MLVFTIFFNRLHEVLSPWPLTYGTHIHTCASVLFFSLCQVGNAGRKSRLLLAMSTAAEFRDHLTSFSELYASLGELYCYIIVVTLNLSQFTLV